MGKKLPAVGARVDRGVRRHARGAWRDVWRDSEGCISEVRQDGDSVRVVRGKGYVQPGQTACVLEDTGNGFIARFPGARSCDMDHCISLDYGQARDLVLALAWHAKDLGFAA